MQTNSTIYDKGPATFLIPKFYNPADWENAILGQGTYTVKDFEKLPQGAPYQLIGGKLVMTPAPETYHQDILRELVFKLYQFLQQNDLGKVYNAPIDVQLSDTEIYQPDIIFIGKERLHIIGEKRITGAPDLVIEILSPSTAYYDLREKYRKYEQYEVKEYWIVDPKIHKVEIFVNKDRKFNLNNEAEKKGTVYSNILKDFSISLSDIF